MKFQNYDSYENHGLYENFFIHRTIINIHENNCENIIIVVRKKHK